MKTMKKSTVYVETVATVTCNMCGEEIKVNQFGYFDEYVTIEKTWGYGSRYDGETHSIDLCENCYTEMLKKLKINVLSQDN